MDTNVHGLPIDRPSPLPEEEARYRTMMMLRDRDYAAHMTCIELRNVGASWLEIMAILVAESGRGCV